MVSIFQLVPSQCSASVCPVPELFSVAPHRGTRSVRSAGHARQNAAACSCGVRGGLDRPARAVPMLGQRHHRAQAADVVPNSTVQEFAPPHDTPDSTPLPPGLGMLWTVHSVPFQRSASGTPVPEGLTVPHSRARARRRARHAIQPALWRPRKVRCRLDRPSRRGDRRSRPYACSHKRDGQTRGNDQPPATGFEITGELHRVPPDVFQRCAEPGERHGTAQG